MEVIEISVKEYYYNQKYFRFMPSVIFDELEKAFVDGRSSAFVPLAEFTEMINSFKNENQNDN